MQKRVIFRGRDEKFSFFGRRQDRPEKSAAVDVDIQLKRCRSTFCNNEKNS